MKRFLTLICVIACVFGLAGCGEADVDKVNYEKQLAREAEDMAQNYMLPLLQQLSSSDESIDIYTPEELEYIFDEQFKISVEGNALLTALDSFEKGQKTVGEILSVESCESTIEKNTILVNLAVSGSVKPGTVEMVFSKDLFLTMESASISAYETVGDLMSKAGLNTLLGMGTVFVVLVLISLIISSFSLISKFQNMANNKKTANEAGIDNAVAQIVVQEEETTDDLELVAVIAAAVAAYEGAASSDGYVVRSIRKVNR